MTAFQCFLKPQGGKPITLTGEEDNAIEFTFKYGGRSGFNSIVVPESADRQIVAFRKAAPGPVKWSLNFIPNASISKSFLPLFIQNLWLLGRGRAVGPNKILYVLVDRRYAVVHRMVDTWFNKLRVSNDFNRPTSDKIDPNIVFLSKATKHHFIPNTCKDAAGGAGALKPRFFPGTGPVGFNRFQPWTAYQAIRWLLSDDGWLATLDEPLLDIDGTKFSFGTIVYSKRLKERKILLRSWNPRKHWPDAMNEVLLEARMGLYVNEAGQFVVEDLEPTNDVFKGYGNYRGAGGVPVERDLGWDAPTEIGTSISYPTWDEIRWDYDQQVSEILATKQRDYNSPVIGNSPVTPVIDLRWFSVDPNARQTFKLMNVLPIPQDIKARGWKVGQWIEINRALRAWFLQAQGDTTGVFAPQNKGAFNSKPENVFTAAVVRRYIITSGLAHLYQRDYQRPEFRNQLLEARVASVYQHWNRTFKIPEEWMDQIEDWRAEVGTVYAGVSRTREPSPVKLDYYSIDSALYAYDKKKTDKGTGHIRNTEIDGGKQFTDTNVVGRKVFDKALFDFRNGRPTDNLLGTAIPAPGSVYNKDFDTFPNAPARINIVDKARGVFNIEFVPDFTGVKEKYAPGLINPESMPISNAGALPGSVLWGQARLLPVFRMSVVLSIKWKAPNNFSRHFKLTPSQVKFPVPPRSHGPSVSIFSRGFEAYRTYKHKAVTWESKGGYLKVKHKGEIANRDILEEFARATYEKLYFRYQPRILGDHSAQGWTGQMPIGHVTQVKVSLAANGAFETTLLGSQPPTPPSVLEEMSPATRNIIQRFEIGTTLDPE